MLSYNYKVDKAMYNWLILKRSEGIPIDGAMIENAIFCASLKFPDFKALDEWMEKRKK